MSNRSELTVVIADDEALARERLRGLLAESARAIHIVGEAANGSELLAVCAAQHPDIVLLDIRMPGMDGIEAALHLSKLNSPPALIFTTAYSEHALAAFESHAVDYLLKPIRRTRLEAALQAATRLNRGQLASLGRDLGHEHGRQQARRHLSAYVQGELRLIDVDDVYVLQADQKYTRVTYASGTVLIDDSLKTLEEEFGDRFVRVHRNALVARARIEVLQRKVGGGGVVRLRGVTEGVNVSRRYVAPLRRMLRTPRR